MLDNNERLDLAKQLSAIVALLAEGGKLIADPSATPISARNYANRAKLDLEAWLVRLPQEAAD